MLKKSNKRLSLYEEFYIELSKHSTSSEKCHLRLSCAIKFLIFHNITVSPTNHTFNIMLHIKSNGEENVRAQNIFPTVQHK